MPILPFFSSQKTSPSGTFSPVKPNTHYRENSPSFAPIGPSQFNKSSSASMVRTSSFSSMKFEPLNESDSLATKESHGFNCADFVPVHDNSNMPPHHIKSPHNLMICNSTPHSNLQLHGTQPKIAFSKPNQHTDLP